MASAMASHRSSTVLAAAFLRSALSLEKAISIGLLGTVGRKQQGCAGGFDGLADVVGGQVVHVSGVVRVPGPFHIGVHRPVHRGRQAGEAQAGGQRGGLPMAMGYGGPAPFAFARPSPQPRHLRRRAGLVDEDQPFRSEPCLAFEPEPAPREHVRAAPMHGQSFFVRQPALGEEVPIEAPEPRGANPGQRHILDQIQ